MAILFHKHNIKDTFTKRNKNFINLFAYLGRQTTRLETDIISKILQIRQILLRIVIPVKTGIVFIFYLLKETELSIYKGYLVWIPASAGMTR